LPTSGELLLAFEFFDGSDARLLGTLSAIRCDNADGSSRVFAVSPSISALWLVFLAEQMVEANLQKVVGPTQLHLDLGVSKQMIV
jgi:hypothetical protein